MIGTEHRKHHSPYFTQSNCTATKINLDLLVNHYLGTHRKVNSFVHRGAVVPELVVLTLGLQNSCKEAIMFVYSSRWLAVRASPLSSSVLGEVNQGLKFS